MRKPDFCLCKNKGTYQLCSYCGVFGFASWIVQSLFFLFSFQASRAASLAVEAGLFRIVQKPRLLVSHAKAHFENKRLIIGKMQI